MPDPTETTPPANSSSTIIATIPIPPPAAGGWAPNQLTNLILSASVAGGIAVLDLADSDMTPKRIAIAFGKGAVGFLATFLGLRSAGTRVGLQ